MSESHMHHVTTAMAHTLNDDGSWWCPVCHPNQHACVNCISHAYLLLDHTPAPESRESGDTRD